MPATTYALLASACPAPCGPGAVVTAYDASLTNGVASNTYGSKPMLVDAGDLIVSGNWNAKSIDLAAKSGAIGYGVLDGLGFSAVGTVLTVGKGHALIDAVVELSADTTCAMLDGFTNYIWLRRGVSGAAAVLVVVQTAANQANAALLGSVPVAGGVATAFDFSGVFYWENGMTRRTADTGFPSDTPSVAWWFETVTLGGTYRWNGIEYIALQPKDSTMRTGALAESVSRQLVAGDSGAILASGTLFLIAIDIKKKTVISNLTFLSGTTALGTCTHLWAALFTSARVLLSQSVDAPAATWAANTEKTFALGAPQTVLPGLYYIGIMAAVSAGSVPSLMAASLNAIVTALAPILAGPTSDVGLTTAAPATAGAITANAKFPYVQGS